MALSALLFVTFVSIVRCIDDSLHSLQTASIRYAVSPPLLAPALLRGGRALLRGATRAVTRCAAARTGL